ncbi:RICIN domain-containing protein [Streptomyces coerulescens]|uniref:RICIN domain-containing protein n=1 Tax=Streptomyces coerulescens TaxID=29304 RepID=A0ABW0CTN9_STRCD
MPSPSTYADGGTMVRLRRVFAVILGAGLFVFMGVAPAQAAPINGRVYWVTNLHTPDHCLLVRAGGKAVQYPCSNYNDQKWQFLDGGPDGYYQLKNVSSGKCLAAPDKEQNAQVGVKTCNASDAWQIWHYFFSDSPTGWQIANVQSGKCLVTRGAVRETPVVQYSCAHYADQFWQHMTGL